LHWMLGMSSVASSTTISKGRQVIPRKAQEIH